VPLSYSVADLASEIHSIDAVRSGRARPIGADDGRRRGDDDRGRWYTRRVVDAGVMIETLAQRRWLPAIYFIFSRAGCERALDDYLGEGRQLLTAEQRAEVDRAIADVVADSPTIAESALNQTVFAGLRVGVGLHHAGVLPSVKRLIEQLFERGLCQVVFATETMSLGIHMPAKSVVLQGLTKRTDRGFRGLTHNELTQMAGRAGRRGIDPEGHCVIALDARDGIEDVVRTVDAPPEPIESQFKLGYGSVAQLLGTGAEPDVLRRRVESSFGQYQNLKRIRGLEAEVHGLEVALEEARRYEAPCGDFRRITRYRQLRQEAEARRLALGRGGRRGERSVFDAEPGRLVLVRRRGGGALGAIVGVHSIRGHRVIVDVLLAHGGIVRVKAGLIKKIFWGTPPLSVPRDAAREPRRYRALADRLGALSLDELLDAERHTGPEAELSSIECHRCRWGATSRCDAAARDIQRLAERLAQRREALEAYRGAYWQEFLRVVEILEQFGAVTGRALELKGKLVAALRHDNELLLAEAVHRGAFTDLTLAEAASVCSAFVEEARSGDPVFSRAFLKKRPKLRRKLAQLETVAESLHEAQRARHLSMGLAVHAGFMPAVFRWASGDDDWSGIVEASFGGHEGDLIRAMRRLIDLLRQLADAPAVPVEVAALLARAARVVDRGIVLESALI
jgi:superfamily II RNA helicase